MTVEPLVVIRESIILQGDLFMLHTYVAEIGMLAF